MPSVVSWFGQVRVVTAGWVAVEIREQVARGGKASDGQSDDEQNGTGDGADQGGKLHRDV
jgi:hypothetical protein